MPFDFDSIPSRRGTNSLKWSVDTGELPMWVADMDFVTAPAILDAVSARLASGVFGYGVIPEEFSQAIQLWWRSRYDLQIDQTWIAFCIGVVPAISSLVRTFSDPGDSVVIQSPVYDSFYSAVERSSRRVVVNNLGYDSSSYRIDWEDLDEKLADPRSTILLICNPQNPTGQVWTPDELARMAELATTHGAIVISDEIHCDITEPGVRYTPYARVAGGGFTLVSATKSFNIPGLQGAALIADDPEMRVRAVNGLERDGITHPNAFSIESTIAAYTLGEPWLEEMRTYVWANRTRLETYVADRLSQLHVVPSQSTYLAWVDCSGLTSDGTAFAHHLRKTTGLVVNPGAHYGANAVPFIRINFACPTSLLEDGLARLSKAVSTFPSI